jgi:hypothetical protein
MNVNFSFYPYVNTRVITARVKDSINVPIYEDSIILSTNSNFSLLNDFVGTSRFVVKNDAKDDVRNLAHSDEQQFSSISYKNSLECASQLYPSPQLKGCNLIIIDNLLLSKCLLTTSSSAKILGLKGNFHCNGYLEGLIGDLTIDTFF